MSDGNHNDIEKNSDNGTFFYKLRNGSLPFEYDTERLLEKIYSTIERNNKDIACGLISAIIANYVSKKCTFSNNTAGFIAFLFVGYFLLKVVVYVQDKIFGFLCHGLKRKIITEIDEEEAQEFFYKKIVVQSTYVFSVVKRSKELEDDDDKKGLCFMYAMQGQYGIRKIGVEIGKMINTVSPKKLKSYIDAIGRESLLKIMNMLLECLDYVEPVMGNSANDADRERIENIKGIIEET